MEMNYMDMFEEKTVPTVAIIGLGYVGLPLALLADKKGYMVVGVDVNEDRVNQINNKTLRSTEKEITERLKSSDIVATTNFLAIGAAQVIILCVPTPVYKNRVPNLVPLLDALKYIAPHLKKNQLIILESTVNPGVTDEIIIPFIKKHSSLEIGKDIFIAHAPERINPGDAIWHVENIPRVVGGYNEDSLLRALEFYRSILSGEIKSMGNIKEAESVKIVENAFRDVNIAFVNELALSFSRIGVNLHNVIEGAATKPFAFMPHYPGCGVGGHCIPVDPYYLIRYARRNGFVHDFLILARKINAKMPHYTARLLIQKLKEKNIDPENKKVAVLGLAYKPNIDDARESPSYEIIKSLKKAGLAVCIYDPYIPDQSTVSSLDEALEGACGVIIATAHSQFTKLTPEDFKRKGVEIVIDGRNCLPRNSFINSEVDYQGIGV